MQRRTSRSRRARRLPRLEDPGARDQHRADRRPAEGHGARAHRVRCSSIRASCRTWASRCASSRRVRRRGGARAAGSGRQRVRDATTARPSSGSCATARSSGAPCSPVPQRGGQVPVTAASRAARRVVVDPPRRAARRRAPWSCRPRHERVAGRDRTPIVRIRDLVKEYRRGAEVVRVLDGLSLDIAQGDFVALMGPSGSGKSTLLNLIGGLDRPTSGTLEVDGLRVDQLGDAALARWRADHVGFVFQMYNLLPVPHGRAQRRAAAAAQGPEPRAAHAARGRGAQPGRPRRTARSTGRASSRAARSSASASRAPSSPTRRCCSATSRPATSTASPATRSSPARGAQPTSTARPSSW